MPPVSALLRKLAVMSYRGTANPREAARVAREAETVLRQYPKDAPVAVTRIRSLIQNLLHSDTDPVRPSRPPTPLVAPPRERVGGKMSGRGQLPMEVEDSVIRPDKEALDLGRLVTDLKRKLPTFVTQQARDQGSHLVRAQSPFPAPPEQAPREWHKGPARVTPSPLRRSGLPVPDQPVGPDVPTVPLKGDRRTQFNAIARRTGWTHAPEQADTGATHARLPGSRAIMNVIAPTGVLTPVATEIDESLRRLSQMARTQHEDIPALTRTLHEIAQTPDVLQIKRDIQSLLDLRRPVRPVVKPEEVPRSGDSLYAGPATREDLKKRAQAMQEGEYGQGFSNKTAESLRDQSTTPDWLITKHKERGLKEALDEDRLVQPEVLHTTRGINAGTTRALLVNTRQLGAILAKTRTAPDKVIALTDDGGTALIRVLKVNPLGAEAGVQGGPVATKTKFGTDFLEPALDPLAGELNMSAGQIRAHHSLREQQPYFVVRLERADKAATPGVPNRIFTNPPTYRFDQDKTLKGKGSTRVTLPKTGTVRGNQPFGRASHNLETTAAKKKPSEIEGRIQEDTGRTDPFEIRVLPNEPLARSIGAGDTGVIGGFSSKIPPPVALKSVALDAGSYPIRLTPREAQSHYERLSQIRPDKLTRDERYLLNLVRPQFEAPTSAVAALGESIAGLTNAERVAQKLGARPPGPAPGLAPGGGARMGSRPGRSTMVGGPNVRIPLNQQRQVPPAPVPTPPPPPLAGRTFRIVPSKDAAYDVLAMRVGGKDMNNTKAGEPGWLGNPWSWEGNRGPKGVTREQVVEQFRQAFLKRVEADPEYRQAVLALRDKTVGYYRGDEPGSHIKIIQEWLAAQPEGATTGVLSLKRIISGGQTGGDQGGLRAGRALGLETGGTMPKGFRTDQGSDPLLAKAFNLTEHASRDYVPRTIQNVNDADVTIAFLWGPSVGTSKTIGYAQSGTWANGVPKTTLQGHRPVLVVTTRNLSEAAAQIRQFLEETGAKTANIAGHRESTQKGIGTFVEQSLIQAVRGPGSLLKKAIPGVMLGGAAASLLGDALPPAADDEERAGSERPAAPSTADRLTADLAKVQVKTAGTIPSLPALKQIAAQVGEEWVHLERPWKRLLDFAGGLGVGAAMGDVKSGAIAGGLLAGFEPKTVPFSPSLEASIPVLRELRATRDLPVRGPDAVTGVLNKIRQIGVDWAAPLKQPFTRGTTPIDPRAIALYETNTGGAGGRLDAAIHPMRQHMQALLERGAYGYFRDFVDLMGAVRQGDVLREHVLDYTTLARRATSTKDAHALMAMANQASAALKASGPREAGAREGLRLMRSTLGEEQFQSLLPAWESYQTVARKGIEALNTTGALDPRMYQRYIKRPFYVPLHRVQGEIAFEDPLTVVLRQNLDRTFAGRGHAGAVGLKEERVLDQMIGSLKPTLDPIETLYNMQEGIYREVGKNNAGKAIAESALAHQSEFPDAIQSIIRRLRPEEVSQVKGIHDGVISFMDQGQRVDVAVPRVWADIVNFIQPDDAHAGFKTLNLFRRLLQATATGYNMAFMARNVPRDVADAILNLRTKTGGQINVPTFLKHWGASFSEMMRDEMQSGGMRERWLNAGGDYSTMSSHLGPAEEMLGMRPLTPFGNIRAKARRLLNASEKATKLASFKTLVGGGMDDVAAAAETRKYGGSPDFYIQGQIGHKARQLWMFFGPQVQGIDRTVQRYRTMPVRLATHLAGLTAAGVALDAHNTSFINPDTGTPELDLIPLSERRTNIIIMLGGPPQMSSSGQLRQPYIKIPLGHTAQALMTPIMETLAAARGAISPTQVAIDTAGALVPGQTSIDAKDPLTGIGQGLIQGLNPAIKAPIEQLANMSMFNRAPIVGRRVAQRLPVEQWTEKTSPTMIELGRAISGVPLLGTTRAASPDRLEHLWRSFLPGPGEQVLSLADWGRRPPQARSGTEAWAATPGIGPVFRSFLPSQGNQMGMDLRDRLFDKADRTQTLVTTINDMLKVDPRRAEWYAEQPEVQEALAINKDLQAASRQIAALSREKIRLQHDPELSASLKRQYMRELYLQEIDILRGISPTVAGQM